MSSRGRGYNNRGYNNRGGGYRGNTYRGSGNRGSYENRGGRGGGGYSSYNNESRYTSSSNRFSSRDRIDDSYKKSYRSESSTGYSNRDYGGRSGTPDRKRIRIEGSSGERRTHDGGNYGGGSYARHEGYTERRGYGEERRRSPSRSPFRKSAMGPPRDARAPRRRQPRGRPMRTRGSFRGAPRSRARPFRRFVDRNPAYRPFRDGKNRSSIKSKDDEATSTEEEWDAEENIDTSDDKKEIKVKSIKQDVSPEGVESQGSADEDSGQEEIAAGSEGAETEREPDAASEPAVRKKMALICPHCKDRHVSANSYRAHLLNGRHRAAMGGVARRHKAQLLRMRVAQRQAQRELEAQPGAYLAVRTAFCLVCRLNHRSNRHAHSLTDTHRAMKRFLMPVCRICKISFRSPMIYEHHVCSLEHLRQKKSAGGVRRASPKADGSGDEAMDVDLENFMTLDSVGDVDEVEDEDSGTEKKDETVEKKAPKMEINIGSEHIKKFEVWWCELCRVYLPRAPGGSGEEAEARRKHCRLRLHLSRYVHLRDTTTLRRHAERIHRRLRAQNEKDAANGNEPADKVKVEKADMEDNKKMENGTEASLNVSGNEDKMWADVDKDIGDLLREVDPQQSVASDDDDDLDRYDKFRKSDKKNVDGEENDPAPAENSDKSKTEVEASV